MFVLSPVQTVWRSHSVCCLALHKVLGTLTRLQDFTKKYITLHSSPIIALQIVGIGEKLKASKKKQKMASSAGNCQRDWGKVLNNYIYIWLFLIVLRYPLEFIQIYLILQLTVYLKTSYRRQTVKLKVEVYCLPLARWCNVYFVQCHWL